MFLEYISRRWPNLHSCHLFSSEKTSVHSFVCIDNHFFVFYGTDIASPHLLSLLVLPTHQ